MPIPHGELWLDLLDLSREVPDLRWAWSVLDARERQRAARLVYPLDRDRFIGRRAALRRRLGTLLGLPPQEIYYDQGTSGRPSLSSRQHSDTLRFSISSAGSVALFGFGGGEGFGVDVECELPFPELTQVAAQWLSPAEQLTLAQASPGNRTALFFFYWTGLEARLKASGLGLAAPQARPEPQSAGSEPHLWQGHWEAGQPSTGLTFRLAAATSDPDPGPLIRWTVSDTLQTGPLTQQA